MLRWYSPLEVPQSWESSAVTIGKFDGVHLGHHEILRNLTELADTRGLSTAVVTFDRHPSSLLDPEHAPGDISSLNERLDLLGDMNIEATLVLGLLLNLVIDQLYYCCSPFLSPCVNIAKRADKLIVTLA